MVTKLTLSINEEKVKRAKRLSKRTGRSVSKLFEEFIDEIDKNEQKKTLTFLRLSEPSDPRESTLTRIRQNGYI